jgi:uncharacterized membrane protein
MNTPQEPVEAAPAPFPHVRGGVSPTAPLRWLARGLADFRSCPTASMFYGCSFAAMGFIASVVLARYYQYLAALVCGFLLLAPFLAIGLYEVSRRRSRGAPCSLRPTLAAWRGNAGNIGIYSLILTVIFLVWARASLVTFALFYNSDMPTLQGFLGQVLSLANADFLAAYAGVIAVFGALTFAVSVVSVPLMLDRNQDSVTAMIASFLALVRNLPAMALWGLLIVALTALGFATLYIGLIVTIPLLGHGTWHAYMDLVEPRET